MLLGSGGAEIRTSPLCLELGFRFTGSGPECWELKQLHLIRRGLSPHNRQRLPTMDSRGIAQNRPFPRERAHSWVALDPLWVEGVNIACVCTGMVEAQSVKI